MSEQPARHLLVAGAQRCGTTYLHAALEAHPAVQPILMLASFYGLAEALSRHRGLDPDSPPHLAKVTRTL